MPVNEQMYQLIRKELEANHTLLVAVSKTKPVADIKELYDFGQKNFGENYVQELVEKHEALPKDIYWHFIGHLQSNKVKHIAPSVHLIHGVDSERLLIEINKQAKKNNRIIDCLLQVHIAQEETKFGFDDSELSDILNKIASGNLQLQNVSVRGLMGMASFTDDVDKIRKEFCHLKNLYQSYISLLPGFNILSMGMSADYKLAIECGSNMVRIGSLLFGAR
jgi:PLP dependent protein